MSYAIAVIVFVLVAVAAALLTGMLRRYALRRGIVDVPGPRSLHADPTPRGGGLAVACCLFTGVAVLWITGQVPTMLAIVLVAGGSFVTLIGWLDDQHHLPALWRAIAYVAAAAMAACLLGGVPEITVGQSAVVAGQAGMVFAAIGLAWLINLYNFMDGADGLAAIEAITAVTAAGFLFHSGGDGGAAWICLILAAACAGFLWWNRPPARIFLGDSGSCLIGFVLGVLAIHGETVDEVPVLAWTILLCVFIIDATLTLLRRVIGGEKWYSAHRTHAYQLLVLAGMSHQQLALGVLGLNALFLGPLAVYATLNRGFLMPATIFACTAITILWTAIQLRLQPRFRPE